jgi:hypothetical protein
VFAAVLTHLFLPSLVLSGLMDLIAVISLMRIQVFMLALLLDVKKARRLMRAFFKVVLQRLFAMQHYING